METQPDPGGDPAEPRTREVGRRSRAGGAPCWPRGGRFPPTPDAFVGRGVPGTPRSGPFPAPSQDRAAGRALLPAGTRGAVELSPGPADIQPASLLKQGEETPEHWRPSLAGPPRSVSGKTSKTNTHSVSSQAVLSRMLGGRWQGGPAQGEGDPGCVQAAAQMPPEKDTMSQSQDCGAPT
ncbi:hypothetical protein P7K49_002016 [Saguinus oedipus]|uniref:Uncharacterized protein n=1 Tax=Saguinus oedipus TaxID=9490 RepID=A0ABQ9WGR0_SAGOE|nr:hypothetical protein P7K49_002016 [Saguinus oedipus]